ncbi:MAG: hypothetical protein AMXMBFR13_50430 [Phycisphaerae bacterium]
MPLEARVERRGTEEPGSIGAAYLAECRAALAAAMRKIAHCLEQLSEQELHWRPHASHNSLQNIILHLCGNVRQWIICPLTRAPDERDRPAEFAEQPPMTRAELLAMLEATVVEADQALARLAPEQLLQPLHVQEWDTTLLAALFDSVSHFVGHTHQIVYITRMQVGEGYRFQWTPREG